MAIPATRVDFKNYCLRNLGAPVLEINVDDDQLEDRIDEALDIFRLYHYILHIQFREQIHQRLYLVQHAHVERRALALLHLLPIGFEFSAESFDGASHAIKQGLGAFGKALRRLAFNVFGDLFPILQRHRKRRPIGDWLEPDIYPEIFLQGARMRVERDIPHIAQVYFSLLHKLRVRPHEPSHLFGVLGLQGA